MNITQKISELAKRYNKELRYYHSRSTTVNELAEFLLELKEYLELLIFKLEIKEAS
ncbi:MAG: hypothetical protein Q8P06_01820 [Candidatus Azambacteria bacterium]|nr:hypothetical protein [Candidatus Azambacteria bacterium]